VGQFFVEGEPEPDRFQIGQVIGGQYLPLDNREGDFDLLEPTGVDWGMDQNETRSALTPPLLRGSTAMRRAVVPDPEPPFARPRRFLSQHLVDEPTKRANARRRFTTAYHIPSAHIPCGQVLQGPPALVVVRDIGRSTRWGGREG
jgi:hypothetical protein